MPFQDRLVAELRLAAITDRNGANAFLPAFLARYNTRFARPPAQPQPAYRRWPPALHPDTVFCFKYLRTVAQDHTVTLGPQLLQILPNGRSYAKAHVEIHKRLDGSLTVVYQGHRVASRLITSRPAPTSLRPRKDQRIPAAAPPPRWVATPARKTATTRQTLRGSYKPAANHPWRQYEQERRLKALRRLQRTKSQVT